MVGVVVVVIVEVVVVIYTTVMYRVDNSWTNLNIKRPSGIVVVTLLFVTNDLFSIKQSLS